MFSHTYWQVEGLLFRVGLVLVALSATAFAGWWITRDPDSAIPTIILLVGLMSAIVWIMRQPYIGIAITVATLPILRVLPTLPLANSITALLGGLTLVAFLAGRTFRRQSTRAIWRHEYTLAIWFLASTLVSTLGGGLLYGMSADRIWFLTYLQLGLLFWLTEQLLVTEQKIRMLMLVFLGAVQITAASSIWHYFTMPYVGYYIEGGGLVGNANELALYTDIGVIMGYYLLQNERRLFPRALLLAVTIVSGIATILSASRGGILSLLAVGVYLILNQVMRTGKIGLGRGARLVLILTGVLGLAFAVLPDIYIERVAGIPEAILLGEGTVGIRYVAWQVAINVWLQNPILGVGPGGFPSFFALSRALPPYYGTIGVHSMYLTVLAENGIFGLIPFLWLLGLTVRNLLRAEAQARKLDSSLVTLIVVWQSILLLLILLGSKMDIQHSKILWLTYGMGIAIPALLDHNIRKSSPSP